MKKLNAHRIAVDSGVTHLFSDFAEDGDMWSGEGERTNITSVLFSEPFLSPPSIQIGFSLWDISNNANTRVDLKADNITAAGFDIVFTTWGDTQIARMHANWMAIGESEDEDVWDV